MESPRAGFLEAIHHESGLGDTLQNSIDNVGDSNCNIRVASSETEKAVARVPSQLNDDEVLRQPWGMKWRSASWYITSVVCVGILTDILTYTIVVPVLPYRLQALNYTNISSLTSWLLFAYSAGIFISTFPVAFFFHRYPWRREPLIVAVLILEAALVLFMLARPFWAMVIARAIQGACSSVVWTVGFALICENVDPKNMGKHLGFAFSGLSVGTTIAPPIGGALYDHLGWYAPFIFCIIVCALDTIARMFIIERKDILKWNAREAKRRQSAQGSTIARTTATSNTIVSSAIHATETDCNGEPVLESELPNSSSVVEKPKELSPLQVLIALASMPRGTVAFGLVFVFGLIIGALDPTLTLRIQSTWNKDSDFVGLVYLAAAAPTFFVGPISGAIADKYGAEWTVVPAIILSLPWIPLMILKTSLPAFIVYFAFADIFITVLNSASSLEMAIISRQKEGISEIHEFASLNVAFSVSSAVGAIVGGQIYDHVSNGWEVVCWISFSFLVISIPAPLIFTGSRPLLGRILGRRSTTTNEPLNVIHATSPSAIGSEVV